VHVEDLRDGTFYGAVFIRRGAEVIEVDARRPTPSPWRSAAERPPA
jgi:hypothetical protein